MSTATIPSVEVEQRVLIRGVSWQTYLMLLADIGEGHIRLTYDRGRLEIMAPSYRHEAYGRTFGLLLPVLSEELNVPLKGGGSTTFKREDVERGLEPDECFYIQHISLILGKDEIDLTVDPPPDLAIEIDITHSSVNRMGVCAALKVPEIWRYAEGRLRIYVLKEDGEYQESPESPTFPGVSPKEIASFIQQSPTMDDVSLIRAFRAWVRKEVVPRWKGGGDAH